MEKRLTSNFIELQLIEACMEDDHATAAEIVRKMTKWERDSLANALDAALGLLEQRWDD